jgi:hypothetical protein
MSHRPTASHVLTPADAGICEETVVKLAARLGFETIISRGNDSLDFHEVSCESLAKALRQAFEAGFAVGSGSRIEEYLTVARSTRYFAGTNGERTVFRASTRVYASASFGRFGLSFSSAAGPVGSFPVREITKAEYDALVALKTARILAARGPGALVGPQDSWVANSDLPSSGGEG